MPGNTDKELDDFDSFNDLNDDGPSGKGVRLPEPRDEGGEDDDIAVEIVDDTPPEDRKKPLARPVDDPTDEELQNYGERARKRIGELTHARHDERRRAEALARERDEAVRAAQALLDRNRQYEEIIKNGSEQFKSVSTEAAEAAVNAAKAKLRKAKEDYDTDAEIDALAELQNANIRLSNAKNFTPPTSQTREDGVQPRQTADGGQSGAQVEPETQAWLQRNRWFNDPQHIEARAYALGVHQKLVSEGYNPRSDEYFEQIDARMKKRFPDVVARDADDTEDEPRRSQAPRRSAVAPASRTTATKKITLTASQVAIARSLGLTPQQYAAQLIKEAKNG